MENLVVRIKVRAGAATPIPAVTATLAPVVSATPRPVLPTQPPPPTTGEVCVRAFNDLNGDGQQGADESLLAGMTFVFSDASGPIDSYTTDGASEPHCFTNLALGIYQLTIKPPASYAGTTPGATSINLAAGLKPTITYGAMRRGAAPAPTGSPSGQAASGGSLASTVRTVAIVIGVLVLVGLAVVGGMLLLSRRRP
jgi:SdrD B-like domain